MYLEFRITLYKVVWSLFTNRFYVTCLTKKISHISYVVDSEREFSRIQIEDMLYKYLFFDRSQIMLNVTFFGLRDTVLYLITENGFRDVVHLYSTSDRHFLIYMNSLNNKKNLDFLKLRVHCIFVL